MYNSFFKFGGRNELTVEVMTGSSSHAHVGLFVGRITIKVNDRSFGVEIVEL